MYIVVKETLIVPNDEAIAAWANRNKEVVIKTCTPFTGCKSEKNNEQTDYTKDTDVVILTYKIIESSEIICKHLDVYANTININRC